MTRVVQFQGLGFEKGQGKSGLAESAGRARSYFPRLADSGLSFVDRGDIESALEAQENRFHREIELERMNWTPYLRAFLRVRALLRNPQPVLNWGGDHSVGLSTVGAFVHQYDDGYVVWIDAHADLNLPAASPTGFLHGMPLALAMNLGGVGARRIGWFQRFLKPSRLVYVGVRDLDPFERDTIATLGIKCFDAAEIRRRGMAAVCDDVEKITRGSPLHVSFDIDVMDPLFAPATGVPVQGGLGPVDLATLGERLFSHANVRCVDVVEVNPRLGDPLEVDQTYLSAFRFLNAVFTHQGGTYARVGQRHQGYDQTSLEPSP